MSFFTEGDSDPSVEQKRKYDVLRCLAAGSDFAALDNICRLEVKKPSKQSPRKTFKPINYFLKNNRHNCQTKKSKKSGLGLEETKKQREEFYD